MGLHTHGHQWAYTCLAQSGSTRTWPPTGLHTLGHQRALTYSDTNGPTHTQPPIGLHIPGHPCAYTHLVAYQYTHLWPPMGLQILGHPVSLHSLCFLLGRHVNSTFSSNNNAVLRSLYLNFCFHRNLFRYLRFTTNLFFPALLSTTDSGLHTCGIG